MSDVLVEFAIASLLLIALPGPDQALILRNSVVGGPTAGLRTMLGGVTGLTLHAGAAAVGVSALLATSATAYAALKLVGLAYLLYLGIRMLRARPSSAGGDAGSSRGRPFAQGFVSNALNPKVALFFLTFVPQFLPDSGASLPLALALSATFALIYAIWFTAMIALVGTVSEVLRRPSVSTWAERIAGAAMIGFGAKLAAAGRH